MTDGLRLLRPADKVLIGLLGLVTLGFAVAFLLIDDAERWFPLSLAVTFGGVWIVAMVAAFAPRRRQDLATQPDGALTIVSPRIIATGLLISWLAAFTVPVAGLVAAAVSENGPRVGRLGIVSAGVLLTLPDLIRLLTGRLHRWRLTIRPEGLTYRGYRTDVTVPWSGMHRPRLREAARRQPAGVVLDLKGNRPDPLIPALAFTVRPEQIVEEIERARRAYRP